MIDQLHEKIPEHERSKAFFLIRKHEEEKLNTIVHESEIASATLVIGGHRQNSNANEEDYEG